MVAVNVPRIADNRLRDLRTERGLTLSQVADALGLRLMQVWRYEQRVRAVPDNTRVAFAVFYGVPVEQIFLYPLQPSTGDGPKRDSDSDEEDGDDAQ